MSIAFTIPGEPKGKGRHRTNLETKRTYTPKATENYEALAGYCCHNEMLKSKIDKLEGQIKATINCYFGIPKSKSKKVKEQMADGLIRPTKKPDADNIAKIVLDSLNGIAYDDDKQIVELRVLKFYSNTPEVNVYLEAL